MAQQKYLDALKSALIDEISRQNPAPKGAGVSVMTVNAGEILVAVEDLLVLTLLPSLCADCTEDFITAFAIRLRQKISHQQHLTQELDDWLSKELLQ